MLSAKTCNRALAAVSSFSEFLISSEKYAGLDNPIVKKVDQAAARLPDRYSPPLTNTRRQQPARRVLRVKTVEPVPRPSPDVSTGFWSMGCQLTCVAAQTAGRTASSTTGSAMPNAAEEAELIKVIRRYVTPDRGYLKLGSALLGMTKRERAKFTRKLGQAASEVTPRQLGILLDGGWGERKTAAWLITVARRTDYRERLGELLLASEGSYAGQSYCVALTAFGTPADADLLAAYLDRYLLRPDHLLRPGARHRRTPSPRHQTRCRSGAPVAYCATSREFPCVQLNPCPPGQGVRPPWSVLRSGDRASGFSMSSHFVRSTAIGMKARRQPQPETPGLLRQPR